MLKRQIEMAVLVLSKIKTKPESTALADVAEELGCSMSYVEKVTRPLVRAGLITGQKRVGSSRGRDLNDITLREVCDAMLEDPNNVGNFDDSLLPYFENIKLSSIVE